MRKIVLIIVLASLACSRSSETPDTTAAVSSDSVVAATSDTAQPDPGEPGVKTCGVPGTPRLDDNGVGELKQGRLLSEVAALCEVISDGQQQGQEGAMERVVVLQIAGETVRSVIQRDRIDRIQINAPLFRTVDSLGVDTPLSRIAAMRGAQFAPGEDGVYGFSPEHCGLSFRFSVPWRPPAGGQWTAAAIAREHGTAAVDRVIVIPCRR